MANNILVVAEQVEGKFSDITFEMLGKAREMAESNGGSVSLIVFGKSPESLKEVSGNTDTVYHILDDVFDTYNPEAYQQATIFIAREVMPVMTFIGSTSIGLDLAGPLSVKLGFPLVTNCIDIVKRDGTITSTCQLYGGKMMVKIEVGSTPTIFSILPGVFRAERRIKEEDIPVKEIFVGIQSAQLRTQFRRMVKPDAKDIDITKSPALVSVGRGIQNKDNISIVQELAELLGGAVSASRPVVDQGWLPMTRQVGRSGMITKPKVYIALGISGAPEHVEGMKDAETIIAINTDSRAPIFSIAHYGIVGDMMDLIPALTEELKKRTS